ncbi:MAG: UDP-N-acetylmuramoylalanyl-D-glutamyl-2,6-diaminopimelate--D-alanyl-D-alanine ligase [Labilithrix sp.]|nr:UDP-N-acetylmuramoylalanyl-D-glutamyl-2,6-diaminopimelate--D-alanyl-D-alanine ligase [Labilithrix sp.]
MATPIPVNKARFTIAEIVAATRGTVARPGPARSAPAVSVSSDSRSVPEGGIFVALKGEAHDGHAFLVPACKRGIAVAIVERGRAAAADDPSADAVTFVEVDDTLVALGDLARAHLEAWRAGAHDRKVVAITGSAGKTTTKELTAALFGAIGKTHYTAGNLNNRVGVPFVVLGIGDEHRFAVLEMGMSLPGELDAITSFARPDIAVVTNVGVAHSEGVGGPDGVMHEKGAVYRALHDSGVAIVNADDERASRAAAGTRAKTVVTFGTAGNAAYRIVRREPRGQSGSRVVLATPGRELSVDLPLPGEAAAIDLTAALAAQETASGVLLPAETIESELATVELVGRATIKRLGDDIVVLDDTYNANPASMRVALSTLAEIAGERRRVAVLGEMKELGTHAESEHVALGDAIAGAGVALAIGCGGLISRALERASALGVTCVATASTEEATREAVARVRPSDAVLVKGSRSVGAERAVAALIETWPGATKSESSGSA